MNSGCLLTSRGFLFRGEGQGQGTGLIWSLEVGGGRVSGAPACSSLT